MLQLLLPAVLLVPAAHELQRLLPAVAFKVPAEHAVQLFVTLSHTSIARLANCKDQANKGHLSAWPARVQGI